MTYLIRFLFLLAIIFIDLPKAKSQPEIGYLISVTSKTDGSLNPLADKVLYKAHGFFGNSYDSIRTDLFIYTGNLNYNEINNDLKANIALYNIVIIPLHDPVTKAELSGINKIFRKMKINTEGNSVKDWTNYFKSRINNKYTYQLIFNKQFDHNKNMLYKIKPTNQVPAYLKSIVVNNVVDTTHKSIINIGSDSLVLVRDTVIQQIVEKDAPSPPPFPPKNLNKMTDLQIKKWLIKQDVRNLKEDQIHIKRSLSEIEIVIDFGDFTDSFSYPIK